ADDLPEDVYRDMIPEGLDQSDDYLRSAVEETFGEEEVAVLCQWFSTWEGTTFKAEVAPAVADNLAGVGVLAVGGVDDFYMFSGPEDFPLSSQVWGYFDLEAAESGPYVANPDLALWQVGVTENGVVIKQPPF